MRPPAEVPGMTDTEPTVRRIDVPDSRALDITWVADAVYLYLDGKKIVAMSPRVAQYLADAAQACATAAANPERQP